MVFLKTVEYYNKNQKITVNNSLWKVFDKKTAIFRPHIINIATLLNISYIGSKSEPLGKYFKNAACPNTGIIFFSGLR